MDPVLSLLPPTHIVQICYPVLSNPLHTLYKYLSSSLPFTPYTHCTNMDPVISLLTPTHIVQIFTQFSPFYPYTHCTINYPILSLLPPTPIVQIWIQFFPFDPLHTLFLPLPTHTLYKYGSSSPPFTPYTDCTNMDPVLSLLPPTPIVQIWIQFSPFYPLHPLYKYGSSYLPFTPYTHCTNIYPVLSLLPLHTLYK